MDSLTHVVLGGCLGQLALGKKVGRKAVIWGAIADTVPDLDVFAGFWSHSVDSLLIHRGITHSILFATIFPVIMGLLLSRWYKNDKVSWKSWAFLLALGTFSHIFIDSLTNYGTGLLEPFSTIRFSYTTIFIADPAFTVSMLLAFIVLVFKSPSLKIKNRFAKTALIISGIYLVGTFINRVHFEKYFNAQFAEQKIKIISQSPTPAPLNNILWGTVARTDSGYYSGFHSLFSKEANTTFHFIPANTVLGSSVQNNQDYKLLNRFAQGYACISLNKEAIPVFHDLRFGTATGWSDTIGGFNFNYPLIIDPKDSSHLANFNPWRSDWEGTRGLWDKILGN
ncbi:MAG: metal-dependent hydrolase [Saprospiraceae bacterium]